jgi:signal transduction histidine kinase
MIRSRLSPPMQLALIFLLFGILWILFSDLITMYIAHNNLNFLSRLQTYKGMLFMVLAAVFIYFISSRIIKQQNSLQNALTDERLKFKNELTLEVFNAQEEERKKLGEELHDNINQLLGVVKLYIEHAQANPMAKDEMLKKSSEYISEVINEIRGLSKSLVSPTLSDIGLIESINDLIDSILDIKPIQIDVHKNGFSEDQLSDIQKLMLYRITQEQLNNILKHSRAEHVDIELKRSGKLIQLIIEDDGVGFDQEEVKSGLGLKNIRHRLELFNGSMKMHTSPQQGCRMEATFEL